LKEEQTYYRWCFSDLTTVQAFVEQFGGTVYVADARRRIVSNIAKLPETSLERG
jgi:hypothetical protein